MSFQYTKSLETHCKLNAVYKGNEGGILSGSKLLSPDIIIRRLHLSNGSKINARAMSKEKFIKTLASYQKGQLEKNVYDRIIALAAQLKYDTKNEQFFPILEKNNNGIMRYLSFHIVPNKKKCLFLVSN